MSNKQKLLDSDPSKQPAQFPTHRHPPELWEQFGRAVASYGFLEEQLCHAIVAITGSKQVTEEHAVQELKVWTENSEKALFSPLGKLIVDYESAVKAHPNVKKLNAEQLVIDLKSVAAYRNPLCHGSWRAPDEQGRSELFFVDRKLRQFQSTIDIQLLRQIQTELTRLICEVINSVVLLGCEPISNRLSDTN